MADRSLCSLLGALASTGQGVAELLSFIPTSHSGPRVRPRVEMRSRLTRHCAQGLKTPSAHVLTRTQPDFGRRRNALTYKIMFIWLPRPTDKTKTTERLFDWARNATRRYPLNRVQHVVSQEARSPFSSLFHTHFYASRISIYACHCHRYIRYL